MSTPYDPSAAVDARYRRIIDERLSRVLAEEGASALLAVESGSRTWGFHSPDSDYDVRFL